MTPPSESRNCEKSVHLRPPHPSKVETDQNQFFQDHHILPKWKLKNQFFQDNHTIPNKKLLKISSVRTTTPPKLESVKHQFFQDHHTLPNQKLLKITSFKTTTPSPSKNC